MTIIDRSAPGVRLTVLPHEKATSGTPLDLSDRLMEFVFEDAERKADKVALKLENGDLALFDREEFMGGTLLEVSWGYPGHMARPRRIAIKKLKGFTTLTLEGHALSVLLNREARTRTFEQMRRADIARQIAAEYGYEGAFVDVEDTGEVLETIHQSAETDARFLRRLAAREELEFYIDGGGFHWRERQQRAAPSHTFVWRGAGGAIMQVNVESDLLRRAGRVTVRGRDPLNKTTVESSTANDSAQRTTLGDVVEVVDPETGATALELRNATASVHPSAAGGEAQARRESQARHRRAERATLKLGMKVVGDPTLRAKSIVEVRGISALLSGKYYVTDVKHIISGAGYTCDLKLVRDGTGRRARRLAQELRGERNRAQARPRDQVTPFERIDPETGMSFLEYHPGDLAAIPDPEAMMTVLVPRQP